MSGTRVRSAIVLFAVVACVCSTATGIGAAQAPASQPLVTMDVVYGHKDGLALTLDPSHLSPAHCVDL